MVTKTRVPLEARFWAKVDKNGPIPEHRPDLGPCWVWTGACVRDGYGNIRVDGKALGAHRVGYEIQIGPIPQGATVLHLCDNPPCVRGAHFDLGTQADNIADMFAKGRANRATGDRNGSRLHPESRPDLRGEKCGHAKLTWLQVREIRARYVPRVVSLYKLADDYGVTVGTIQHIIEGKTWRE